MFLCTINVKHILLFNNEFCCDMMITAVCYYSSHAFYIPFIMHVSSYHASFCNCCQVRQLISLVFNI